MLDTSSQTPTPEAAAPSYKPLFSPPFLDMMMDYGFAALLVILVILVIAKRKGVES